MPNNDNDIQTMRIVIDGEWTATEMAQSFRALDDLYNFRVFIRSDMPHRFYKRLGRRFPFPPEFFLEEFGPLLLFDKMFPLVGSPEVPGEGRDLLYAMMVMLQAVREDDSSVSALEVRAVKYVSEGFKDFAGIGEIVGHVKDFVLRLIEIFITRKHREELCEQARLENEERRRRMEQLDVEIQKQKLENISQYVQIMRDAGFSKVAVKRAMQAIDLRADILGTLIESGKIKAITSIEEDDRGSR
jgi:hypothetical protein